MAASHRQYSSLVLATFKYASPANETMRRNVPHRAVTHAEFNKFAEDLIGHLNEVFEYTFKRFDDLEKRLIRVEDRMNTMDSNITSVKKDTTIIPDIFELLETDGEDIAKINSRVSELEKTARWPSVTESVPKIKKD